MRSIAMMTELVREQQEGVEGEEVMKPCAEGETVGAKLGLQYSVEMS